MCFSATASFTAATVLTLIGAASIRTARKDRSLLALACIPLFFALQQAGEGLVWLNLAHGFETFTDIGKYIFMIFAYLVWPIWIPFALWQAEKTTWRKNLIVFFLLAGLCWSGIQAYNLAGINPAAHIVNNSIQYTANYYSQTALRYLTLTYLLIVAIPAFVSSLRYIWFFGLFAILSAFFSLQYYRENFTSIWCFFAAISSMILYFIIKNARKAR